MVATSRNHNDIAPVRLRCLLLAVLPVPLMPQTRQKVLILVAGVIGCGSAMSPEPAVVNFRLVAPLCSSVLPVALSIDSAVVATDTFRVDVPAEHLQSRDVPVSAGLHTVGARVVGGFVWPSRALTVGVGAVVTDSLPFYCS